MKHLVARSHQVHKSPFRVRDRPRVGNERKQFGRNDRLRRVVLQRLIKSFIHLRFGHFRAGLDAFFEVP